MTGPAFFSSVGMSHVPAAVLAQNMGIMNPARVADAVEELQDLDGSFAAQPDRISIIRGIDTASFPSQRSDDASQCVDAFAVVEQVVHDLADRSACYLPAQNLAHPFLRLSNCGGQISHPGRLGTRLRYERLQLTSELLIALRKRGGVIG